MMPKPVSLALLPIVVALALSAAAARSASADTEAKPSYSSNLQWRGSLNNSLVQFEQRRRGRVAFMGGSITEMNGFRPRVCDYLRKRFPQTDFRFIDAGVASTCSTTGAFRLASDVLADGPVDLFFVEFAVNDDQDARHTRVECIRGMEGIIRHARRQNPNMDIVVVYFVNEGMLQTLQSGGVPLTIEAHESVAAHYAVPTVNLARQVAGEITAGTLTWQRYGGVHPAPLGNDLCARMIAELLDRAWSKPPPPEAVLAAHPLPARRLDAFSYDSGRFIDPQKAQVKHGWTRGIPDWKQLSGEKRSRFTSLPMFCATEPGAEATLSFEGTAVGAYLLAGPDAGIVEASVDGGPFQPVNLYHSFSAGLHYPRTVMYGTELKPGQHTLTLRISAETKSSGHAARIMQFTAN